MPDSKVIRLDTHRIVAPPKREVADLAAWLDRQRNQPTLADELRDTFRNPVTAFALGICTGCLGTVGLAFVWSAM